MAIMWDLQYISGAVKHKYLVQQMERRIVIQLLFMEDLKAILQMQEFLVIVQVLMENAEVLRQLKEPIHMVV